LPCLIGCGDLNPVSGLQRPLFLHILSCDKYMNARISTGV
jgi:hypothetical protein